MSVAQRLRDANIVYRDPALYDDMLADDPTAETVARFVPTVLGPVPRPSVLDLDCGTGRVPITLHHRHRWYATGVDVQPDLIDYARARGSGVEWVHCDIRTVRLGRTFDVVTSVGNTVAYLHTDNDLAQFFHTARVHSHFGSVLVVATLDQPPRGITEPLRTEITTRYGPALVEVDTTWNPERQQLTTTRAWHFADGQHAHDLLIRRVWTPETLRHHADVSGFTVLRHPLPDGITFAAVRT